MEGFATHKIPTSIFYPKKVPAQLIIYSNFTIILEKSPFLEISDTETWISAVQMYKRIVSEFEIDYSASNRPVLLATRDLN